MKEECNHIRQELVSSKPFLEDDGNDDDDVRFGGNKSTSDMVGLSREFNTLKDLLMNHEKSRKSYVIAGMVGIGKTTLARRIYKDPSVRNHFPRRAFVTLGQKYRREEILQAVLSQLNPDIREATSMTKRQLRRCSYGNKRYLIVVDDRWGLEGWDQLEMESYFRDNEKGSRFLVTTRQRKVNVLTMAIDCRSYYIRFLNKEESVFLLREKVFGKDQLFPDPQLEKAAERIVQICEGLPLAIIVVADLLSKVENHTPEYWNEMADIGISIFNYVSGDMMKVLILSYNYLPQYLKACFLYMGVFPPKCELPVSRLINMWFAERFQRMDMVNPEKYARDCLECLASESDIIMVHQKSLKLGRIKTCGVHQHLRVMYPGAPLVLPIEIWNMRRLALLQVMGSKLPYHDGNVLLPNLLTLSYISADSCTKEILEKTPNLKKLGIQIELAPDNIAATAADHFLRCLDHLADHLYKLESLTCEVVNPNPISQVVTFPASFPSSLKNLSLSGLRYPREYMTTVARLPNLQVLKLQCCAFQGPKWEIREEDFPRLESLLLEDLDLEYIWKAILMTTGACTGLPA